MTKKRTDGEYGISDLPKVGEATIEKLNAAGVKTIFDLCIRGSNEINEISGIAHNDAQNIVNMAWKRLEEYKICRPKQMDVMEHYEFRKNLIKIPTMCSNVDYILKGGFELEALTELYGEFGSGKTQICNVATIEAIEKFDYNVLWIDCEDTFRPERLLEIAKTRGYVKDEEEGMKKYFHKITLIHEPNTDELVSTVDNMSELILEKDIKLIVIDGSIGQFRAEYLGRGTLSLRQNNLSRFMEHVKNSAFFFRCAVILTNQVQADPSVSMFHMDPVKPIGGNVVGHASTYRIYLRKAGSKRYMRMVDSPKDGIEDKEFILDAGGISDPKEKK